MARCETECIFAFSRIERSIVIIMTVRITRSQRSAGTIGLYRIDGCFDIIFAYYPNEIAIVIIIIPRCFFFRRTRLGRAAPHHRDIILVWNIIIMITYYRRTRRGVFRTRFSIFDNSGGEEARRCAPSSARCPRVSFVSGTGYTIFFSSIPPPYLLRLLSFLVFFFFLFNGSRRTTWVPPVPPLHVQPVDV